jgi:Family of unknown function (DUF6210)
MNSPDEVFHLISELPEDDQIELYRKLKVFTEFNGSQARWRTILKSEREHNVAYNDVRELSIVLYANGGPGVILLHEQGALYSNQVGGYSVIPCTERGFYLPLVGRASGLCASCNKYLDQRKLGDARYYCAQHECLCATMDKCNVHRNCDGISQEELFSNHFAGELQGRCDSGIESGTADFVDKVLAKSDYTSWIKVDRSRLSDCKEAWIYVNIDKGRVARAEIYAKLLPDLVPEAGVLTWQNSD